MIDQDIAHKTLAAVTRQGDLFADLFAEDTAIATCTSNGGELSALLVRCHQGTSLRRVGRLRTQHVHTPGLGEAGLSALVKALQSGSISALPMPETGHGCADDLPVDEIVGLAHEVARETERNGSLRVTAQVTVRLMRRSVLIARSDGAIVREARCYTKMTIEATARHANKVRSSQRQYGGPLVCDLRHNDIHLRLAREAAEAAVLRLEAVEAPLGEMTVILGPGGPATLLHEACGHALEADLAQHAQSAYHGCLGLQVAAPGVTLIDDPRAPEHAPFYHFDDEGHPAEPTVLIERGILRNYLYDLRSALAAGRASTGHGRRLNYAYPPLPRMSTTYMAPGDTSPEEIIAETARGIFVRSISGGDTDMGSGRFNLQVSEGYLVEDGRLTAPIRGAVLSGLGPAVLRSIDRVGNDSTFMNYCYVCNKLDQFPLLVSVGQPTLRVPRLLVWGG